MEVLKKQKRINRNVSLYYIMLKKRKELQI